MSRGDKWTAEDIIKLLKLIDEKGYAWYDISKEFHERSPEAIRMWYRNNVGETRENTVPRIGLFDLETLPIEAYTWGLHKQYLGQDQVIQHTGLLSWSGKYLNEPKVFSDILTSEEAIARDDERITQSCWLFLHSCDVVVGHNLNKFDSKVSNTFFLLHDLPPLDYRHIDTLAIARRYFRWESNKMGYLNHQLGLSEKIETEGFMLWRRCAEGDPEALERMETYNKQDVIALEDLFYKFRPYIHGFNVAVYNDAEEMQCPVCGCKDLASEGKYYTPAGCWDSLRCSECGAISRAKVNYLEADKKKSLLYNTGGEW